MSMTSGRGQGTVLLVEDSAPTRELISTVLRRAGYDVVPAVDGEDALEQFAGRRPDIVLLDVHLPKMTGWDVLERIRERSELPILMLTALSDDASKVRGLNGGADDFLTKPASASELIARVGALLRRSRLVPGQHAGNIYDDGLVRIDFDLRAVSVNGEELQLTPLEFRLLSVLARNPKRTLSREQLLSQVWHDQTGGPSDHVKIYVGYLRRKLGAVTDVEMIETIRGFGYRWARESVSADAGGWRTGTA